ncbi:uncharacterized protein METZ01_LOCUS98344, partial [marine metagenome]
VKGIDRWRISWGEDMSVIVVVVQSSVQRLAKGQ